MDNCKNYLPENPGRPEYTETGDTPLDQAPAIKTRKDRQNEVAAAYNRNLKASYLQSKLKQAEELPEAAKGAAYCLEFTKPDVNSPIKWFVNENRAVIATDGLQNPVTYNPIKSIITNFEHLRPGVNAWLKDPVTGILKEYGRPVTRIIKIDKEARFKFWFLQGKFTAPFNEFWFYLQPTNAETGYLTEKEAVKALAFILDRMHTETGAQIEIRPTPLYIAE